MTRPDLIALVPSTGFFIFVVALRLLDSRLAIHIHPRYVLTVGSKGSHPAQQSGSNYLQGVKVGHTSTGIGAVVAYPLSVLFLAVSGLGLGVFKYLHLGL